MVVELDARACELSVTPWAELKTEQRGRKSGELKRSGERTFQKTLEREQGREAAELERSEEQAESARLYCIKVTKPILKLFLPSARPIIEAFGPLTPIPNSKENPFIVGV